MHYSQPSAYNGAEGGLVMHYAQYKTILSPQNHMNIYRGCTHGCIDCDSRSRCYQMQHDFEDIEIKQDALEILEAQLRRKRKPCMIGTGAMCDPYIHLEDELQITRQCLELVAQYGFGLAIQTKSARILRGIVQYCIEAQVQAILCFGFGMTLREGNREYYFRMLDRHFPGLKQQYMLRYGQAYSCNSPNNGRLMTILRRECQACGILVGTDSVFRYLGTFEQKPSQLSLF